jgi:diguanylate cyclase (GGDEF)-like protein
MSALPQAASTTAKGKERRRTRRHFAPSSVRALIFFGCGFLLLALAVITIGASYQVRKHQSDLSDLERHSNEASLLQTAEAQASISGLLLQRYVATGDQSYLTEINDHADNAQAALESALANGGPQGLDVVVASGATLVQEAARSAQLRQQGDVEASSAVMEEIVPIFHDYRLRLEDLASQELAEVTRLRSKADRAGDLALWLLISSGSIGITLGLIATFWVARSIIRPLGSLENTARLVSEGDLTARAPVDGPRELAHLGSVLNDMMGKIEQHTAELQHANEELTDRNRELVDARNEAATDPLTGLGNHRAFHNRLREEVMAADTRPDGAVGLIIIDLDGFKEINDTLGHLAGDKVLRDLALRLVQVTRNDSTFRYGGDELAVLLPGASNEDAIAVAERLKAAVLDVPERKGYKVTASLGVASFPSCASTAEELVYRADMAMYWAKANGKNQVTAWDAGLVGDLVANGRYNNTRNSRLDVVSAMLTTLAAKDPTAREHSDRCSQLAVAVATELALPEDQLGSVRLAAQVHEIGRVVTPDAILRKSAPLTDVEQDVLRRHPVDGANMISHLEEFSPAAIAIRHHHEHFDGTGYPDGLAGDRIPLIARILHVVDAYDAMVMRHHLAHEAAIDAMERYRGTRFDPEVLAALARVISHQSADSAETVTPA